VTLAGNERGKYRDRLQQSREITANEGKVQVMKGYRTGVLRASQHAASPLRREERG